MQVHLRSLEDLFAPSIQYRVPPFQRQYVWTKDDQWEALWEDIRDIAEKCLGNGIGSTGPVDESHPADHFLGAIVIQHEDSDTEVAFRSLIDGQQRLVTLQLILGAIEQIVEGYVTTAAQRFRDLVQNREAYTDGNEDLQLKVWPNAADQGGFKTAMLRLEPDAKSAKESQILEARKYFSTVVSQWLESPDMDIEQGLLAIERAVRKHIKMVVISLANSDDEHLIFETLNGRGTPLTDWDLTKNLVLNQGKEVGFEVSTIYDEILDYFEDDYWFEETRTGGAPRARVDLFLNYWMIMRKAEPVESKPRRTFRAIEQYIEEQGRDGVIAIARDMRYTAEAYRESDEHTGIDPYAIFLRRWRAMRVGVMTPLLLRVLVEEPSEAVFNSVLSSLDSYIVRRQLCGLSTRGYYDVSLGGLREFKASGSVEWDQMIESYLINQDQSSDRYRWPTDADVLGVFETRGIYTTMPKIRLRVILEGIEEGLRSQFSDAGPVLGSLSVERIMPQAWRDHWDPPIGFDNPDFDPDAQRDQLVQTMGNLTLVTKSLNSKLSNAPLAEKREALDMHSTLFLNKDFLSHSEGGWDEQSIQQRASRLAEAAIRRWPRPSAL